MSFEKHSIVSAFVETYGSPYCLYDTEDKLYKAIAYALWEKLTKYEEQEALDSASVVDPFPMLYKLLNNAAAIGDTKTIDVASKAIQRITF